MKGQVQNWPWPADRFTNHVGFYFNKAAQLKIGNYQQTDIIHYVEKDLITDETVNTLEEIAWKLR
jgi:putative methionine-R-sulfoxide reductase with GAF domain